MKTQFSVYILLFLTVFCSAQDNNKPDTAQLFYRHFTVQDGLPSNEAYYGYQDRQGYIWICTDNGVSRFDGVQFKNYNSIEGLRSNIILGCKEDSKGKLWMYSFAGELYLYQPSADRFECPAFNDSLSTLLAGRPILDLVFEKDTLYVMTVGAYAKLTFKNTKCSNVVLVEGDPQTLSARILSNGELLVMYSTEENVTRFNFEFSRAGSEAVTTIRNVPINGLVQNQLSSLIQGDDLYIVFGENLLSYNHRTKHYRIEILPFTHIPGLKSSAAGILSGSYGKGLWTIKKNGEQLTFKQLLKNKNVSGSFEDKQGGIWACSQTDGLYFIPNRTALSFPRSPKEASRRVTSLFTSGDTAYYMTYGGALFMVSGKELPLQKRLIEPGQYNMRNMKALNAKEILLFAGGRNMNYNIATGKVGSISPLELCERGTLLSKWQVSARRNELIRKNCEGSVQRETVLYDHWKYGPVLSGVYAEEGRMWLATRNDLIYFDAGTQKLTEVAKKGGLRNFSVKYMLQLGKDSVMVASNQGVFLIVHDQIKKRITVMEGLSSNKVLTLFPLDGELWVGTSRGIDRIKNYQTAAEPVITSVTGVTGISKCPVTHFGCMGNYLLAGTDEGIYLFDRKQIFTKHIRVKPLVTELNINDQKRITDFAEPVELSYDENSLNIGFNALNYRNSLYNKYRYRLKSGDETDWSETSQNHIIFPLLSPGTYDFELQVMNPDGSWSESAENVAIHISKPFWQTWWFITLLLLAAGAGAYVVLLFRVRQMQKVGDLTGKLSEAKMQALGMQLNPHFVFNALNSVSFHMAKNDAKSTLKILGKFAKLMRMVFRNSQHAIIPLEDELKALNLYIELETIRLGKEFTCNINIESINVAECKIPALLLQPFVENAIWHGIGPLKTEGKLELIFLRIGDTLQIEIIDNGVGRRNAALLKTKEDKHRHSLDIIKERLSLLRSKYNCYTHIELMDAFEDREFCGTKVLLIIPWLSDSETRGRDRLLKRFMLDDQSAYN